MLWSFKNACYINTLHELGTAQTYKHNLPDERSANDRQRCHNAQIAAKFGVFYEDHVKLPTLYGLPEFDKRPYKSRFMAHSNSSATTELSIFSTFCLTVIKNHVLKFCQTICQSNGKNLFWSIKNLGEILNQ